MMARRRLTKLALADICSGQGFHQRAAGLFVRAAPLHVEDAAMEYYAAGLPKDALRHLYDNEHFISVIAGLARYVSSSHDNYSITSTNLWFTGVWRKSMMI